MQGTGAQRESIPTVDRRLLARIERSFASIAGTDRVIDAGELMRALGLRSEFLAKRMLASFDRDGNGVISKDEFVEGVRKLVVGSDRDKLAFAFSLHDQDGDGTIDASELVRMIALALADAEVVPHGSHTAETLAAGLLRAADKNGDGRITLEELEVVLAGRPEVLRDLTRCEALWVAPSEDVLARLDAPKSVLMRSARFARFAANRLPFLIATVGWAFLNVVVLTVAFFWEIFGVDAEPLTAFERATGSVLVLDGALVFVPVLRRLATRVRASFFGRVLPVDDAIDVHRLLGHTLLWLGTLHGLAAVAAYLRGHGVENLVWFFLSTQAGASGAILYGVLCVMWLFALSIVRRSRFFELFHFTHLLYVAWLALAIWHAPSFLVWAILASLGLLLEHLFRALRRAFPTTLRSAIPLRSGVTRVELARPASFRFSAGDYAFLRIPAIAGHEWHPFTISSAPEDEVVTFHVRTVGNWSRTLRKLAEAREHDPSAPPLAVHLDGPYGSPTSRAGRVAFPVLVGGGIGVTPFASVLPSLFARRARGETDAPSKVHFFWLARDQYAFEWFAELLARLEQQAGEWLDLHLYMTSGRGGATSLALEAARAVSESSGGADLVTGLRARTRFSQPAWQSALEAIVREHGASGVELFFCGPPGLGRKVRLACAKVGIPYHEERF